VTAGPRLVELSHPIVSGAPGYPGLPVPRVEPWLAHDASRSLYADQAEFEITRIFLVGNTGTYLDSPYHRHRHLPDIAGLQLERLANLPAIRLTVRDGARAVDAMLPPDVAGAAVLIHTGWDRRWGRDAYWAPGPFVATALVDRLLEAGVGLVGIDAWNIDDPADPARPVHTSLLGAGIPIVEHLTGLDGVPARGARFFAVPAPIVGAASMPVRAFAELPRRRVGGF
jgi:kynurenine formamidase